MSALLPLLLLATGALETPVSRLRLPRFRSPRRALSDGVKLAPGADNPAMERLLTDSQISAARDTYSWSLDKARDAYTRSKDVVLQVQTLGRQRLQSLGLLPGWLVDAASEESDVGDESENTFAAALVFASMCELTGPLALIASVVGAAAVGAGLPLKAPRLGVLWAASEAAFFVLCKAVAFGASREPAPATFARNPRRRMLWRRILADPSQTPVEFVEGWMYREREAAAATPSAARLLLRWARGRAGSGVGAPTAAAADAAGLVEPYGVRWAELGYADVQLWLAGSLYSARRRSELTQAQAEELAELMAELQQAAGRTLRGGPEHAAEARRGGGGGAEEGEEHEAASAASAALAGSGGGPTTAGVRSMRTTVEPLRWRHRPLLYYLLSQGVGAGVLTPRAMRAKGYSRHRLGELAYWHRPGAPLDDRADGDSRAAEAFVFIHGVGFGPAPYLELVERFAAGGAPVLLVELPFAAQRVLPRTPPTPARFAALLAEALDRHGLPRAVLAGHSLGSAFASFAARHDAARAGGEAEMEAQAEQWAGQGTAAAEEEDTAAAAAVAGAASEAAGEQMVERRRGRGGRRRRYAGVVYIDPIACNLHHARSTREFVYTRADSSQRSFEDFIFKKELWTSLAIARHLPWDHAAVWPDDCAPQVPTLVAVGSTDAIVPPDRISACFGSWRARLRGVRVLTMQGISHGEWLRNERAAQRLVASVLALRAEAAAIGRATDAAELAAAKAQPLATALAPFAGRYERAAADAEKARLALEKDVALAAQEAAAEAERARGRLEGDFEAALEAAQAAAAAAERARASLTESWQQRAAAGGASEAALGEASGEASDAPAAADAAAAGGPASAPARLSGAAEKAREAAERARGTLEKDVARALAAAADAATAAERARGALGLEGAFSGALEAARATAAEAERARDALRREAARLRDELGSREQPPPE